MSLKRVAALQMNSTADVAQNLKTVERLVIEAIEKGASLVVLPENVALVGKYDTDKLTIAEPFGKGYIQNYLSNLAKKYKIWIVGGTIPIVAEMGRRVSASCIVWDDTGQVQARYDKIHLFDVTVADKEKAHEEIYIESKTIAPGDKLVTLDSPFGKLGLSICYDIRFPELYRKLNSSGAELLCIPAAFTETTGNAHWEILCRARAIENLSYVIASAQVGTHANGRKTFGQSMIIDPWGKILAHLSSGEGAITADIDLTLLKAIREKFPVLQHKKL
jgi:deaminated glutathione amidase